ncbi:hypothetical protein KAT36_00960 [Candidatus Pacearchaeota archaeon]|nr:hypothetical protein [Candidatus Pacearchaeota archaeon]
MDYGGVDRRKTKKDLKRKRLVRGYKRGGKFRSANVDEKSGEKRDKMGKVVVGKKKRKV